MTKFNLSKVMENATQDQKGILLELVTDYTNAIQDLQDIEINLRTAKKAASQRIDSILSGILTMLEEIETGQQGLFDESDDEPEHTDPAGAPDPEPQGGDDEWDH
jgi:hypothetical protein